MLSSLALQTLQRTACFRALKPIGGLGNLDHARRRKSARSGDHLGLISTPFSASSAITLASSASSASSSSS